MVSPASIFETGDLMGGFDIPPIPVIIRATRGLGISEGGMVTSVEPPVIRPVEGKSTTPTLTVVLWFH